MSILTRAADALQKVFSGCALRANELTGVVERVRKFDAGTLAQTFVLALLQNPRAGSEQLAAMASVCGVDVSPQAIEQRYSQKLSDFFRTLLSMMVAESISADKSLAPLLEKFTEVNVLDSSSVQLPESKQAEFPSSGGRGTGGQSVMKAQTSLELRHGQLKYMEFTPGVEPDQGCALQDVPPVPGSLRIADLGYFSIPVLQNIQSANAYFLSRFQRSVSTYIDGKKQDLVTWLNDNNEAVVDRNIEIGASRFRCRLIAFRVPKQVADRRRAKLREHMRDKQGKEPTKEALQACDWAFLITNLSPEQLSVKEAIVLYRSRWQIELLFKRWKSIGLVALLDGRNDCVMMARLWARLCAAVVQHWLIVATGWSSTLLVSFSKLAKIIQEMARELASAINDRDSLENTLARLASQASRRAKRTKRKKRPGTIELLRNPELLDFVLT